MATVLWVILWIFVGLIGLFIGVVLLAILLAALPVSYRIEARTGEEGGSVARVHVRYLFGLVRARYVYEKGTGELDARVAWIKVPRGKKKDIPAESLTPQDQNKASHAKHPDSIRTQSNDGHMVQPAKPDSTGSSLKEKLQKIKSNISMVKDYPNRQIITALTLRTLRKLAKILKPKHIKIAGVLGFTDPAITGLFFAAYEAAAEALRLRKHIQLSGNFDTQQTHISLQISIRGRISLARTALPLIGLALKKPVRKLIGDLIS